MATENKESRITYVTADIAQNGKLQSMLDALGKRIVRVVPAGPLGGPAWSDDDGRSLNDSELLVIDGCTLGPYALDLCRWTRMDGKQTPIVLVWKSNAELDRAVCLEFGANELLCGPFDQVNVAAAIRKCRQVAAEGQAAERGAAGFGSYAYRPAIGYGASPWYA